MLRPRLRLASPLPCALSRHKPGSLDEGPSHFNAGTAPRFAVSLSALWRAAWQSQVKAVAWACCCLGVLPISWGPSVVSTCAGDVSGRAAHICTRGTPKPPQVAGRAALPVCPGVPTALARPPSGGTQVPGLRRPRRWVGGAGKPPARRSPLRGPARPWKELAQAGACCSTKLRGRGRAAPLCRGGDRGSDRRPGSRQAHLVAQLLGLLLQHGVALLVPAHVLVVAEPLHVFQLLMRNFQLLLVVVMFLNFDFKVLQLLLE